MKLSRCIVFVALLVISALRGAGQTASITTGALKGLELRSIGPGLATGRIQDVQIDPKDPSVW